MIVPSIDIQDGKAVQLRGGREKVLEAGDPRELMRQLRVAGEVAVIDLDAALGRGSNAALIRELCAMGRVRVGGGIRDVETALDWLDAGADKVILGTAARPEILGELPRERVIAALDAERGEVMVEGWRSPTGRRVEQAMAELAPYVGGFLVTWIENEGRLTGLEPERLAPLVQAAGGRSLTVAGGIAEPQEIAALDRLGIDAQVGMALYTARFSLADAIAAPLRTDRPDGLWPTVVVDERGEALGLAYSNLESLRTAIARGRGVFWSRRRGLWEKGERSGAWQELLAVTPDCDRDTLRFTVRQHGTGFCHTGRWSCWGDGGGIAALARRIARRAHEAPAGSYTRRLFEEPGLLESKLREEARELAEAAGPDEVRHEAADLLYFTLVALERAGLTLEQLERELDRRALRVRLRGCDAKPETDA